MTRRTGLTFISANTFLVAGLVAVNLLMAPPDISGSDAPSARIGALVGEVYVRRKGETNWVRGKVGDELREGDQIRTGLFSEGALHIRGKSSVVVGASTKFEIRRSGVRRSEFELGTGQITAAIPKGTGREYNFRSKGSDAVASARQGEFNLTSDGKGTVIVDARAGKVTLKARGKETIVKKGKRSVVLPGKAPTKALEVPKSVALQVKWPTTKTDKKNTMVAGSTTAGATVLVNGINVRADQYGNFSLNIPLEEGSNRLVVNVTDSVGNTIRQESPEILVDTKPPDLNVNAKDLWK